MRDPHPERPPFEGHRRYYLVLKNLALLIAVALAVRYFTGLLA